MLRLALLLLVNKTVKEGFRHRERFTSEAFFSLILTKGVFLVGGAYPVHLVKI